MVFYPKRKFFKEVFRIKKYSIILVLIVIAFLSTSCAQQQETVDATTNLEILPKVISSRQESYEVEIIVKNKSKYHFDPFSVFVGIHKGNSGVHEETSVPYLIEAIRDFENEPEKDTFRYKTEIPKQFFNLEPNIDKESVDINVRGFWINDDKQIIKMVNRGIQFFLD